MTWDYRQKDIYSFEAASRGSEVSTEVDSSFFLLGNFNNGRYLKPMSHPAQPSMAPTKISNHQWFAVTTTTIVVISG